MLNSARRTAQQWIQWYNREELDALRDAPRPGQPRKLTTEQESRLCAWIDAGPRSRGRPVRPTRAGDPSPRRTDVRREVIAARRVRDAAPARLLGVDATPAASQGRRRLARAVHQGRPPSCRESQA
ncbi:MAG: helix-turn-helix domain-containing protein [Phycisphaerales bacterium]|nr:helix-turn-helix domain-containing protein [Phycisphaerales bacterium]